MATLSKNERNLLMLGGAGALVLLLYGPQIAAWLARSASRSAVGIPIELAKNIVIGTGEAVGIPQTDPAKCAAAIASQATWDASLYCDAVTFLRYLAGSKPELIDEYRDVAGYGPDPAILAPQGLLPEDISRPAMIYPNP